MNETIWIVDDDPNVRRIMEVLQGGSSNEPVTMGQGRTGRWLLPR